MTRTSSENIPSRGSDEIGRVNRDVELPQTNIEHAACCAGCFPPLGHAAERVAQFVGKLWPFGSSEQNGKQRTDDEEQVQTDQPPQFVPATGQMFSNSNASLPNQTLHPSELNNGDRDTSSSDSSNGETATTEKQKTRFWNWQTSSSSGGSVLKMNVLNTAKYSRAEYRNEQGYQEWFSQKEPYQQFDICLDMRYALTSENFDHAANLLKQEKPENYARYLSRIESSLRKLPDCALTRNFIAQVCDIVLREIPAMEIDRDTKGQILEKFGDIVRSAGKQYHYLFFQSLPDNLIEVALALPVKNAASLFHKLFDMGCGLNFRRKGLPSDRGGLRPDLLHRFEKIEICAKWCNNRALQSAQLLEWSLERPENLKAALEIVRPIDNGNEGSLDKQLEHDKRTGMVRSDWAPNISNMGLESLPEGFETLDFLYKINLSNNRLRSVSTALADMCHPFQSNHRTVIDLRGNPLNQMSQEDFRRLRNLSAGPRFLLHIDPHEQLVHCLQHLLTSENFDHAVSLLKQEKPENFARYLSALRSSLNKLPDNALTSNFIAQICDIVLREIPAMKIGRDTKGQVLEEFGKIVRSAGNQHLYRFFQYLPDNLIEIALALPLENAARLFRELFYKGDVHYLKDRLPSGLDGFPPDLLHRLEKIEICARWCNNRTLQSARLLEWSLERPENLKATLEIVHSIDGCSAQRTSSLKRAANMSNMGLKSLPEGFETLQFPDKIDLSNNRLRSVSTALANMCHSSRPNFRFVIDLSGNPLDQMRPENLELLRNLSAGPLFLFGTAGSK